MASDSFRLVGFREIMGEPLHPVQWLLDGLIGAFDRVLLYGEWGCLKTWLLLSLAIHLAAGKPWLGQFAIPQAQRVLFVNEEDKEATVRRRIQRLAMGAGVESEDLPLKVLSRAGIQLDGTGADNLLRELAERDFNPQVIILETLRRLNPGDENSAKDIRSFWRSCDPLLEAGNTIVVSHHMRKPQANGINAARHRASGSTDVMAGVDCALALIRKGRDAVVVEAVKSRDAEEAARFTVSLYEECRDGPVVLNFEGFEDATGERTKVEEVAEKIVSFLADHPERKENRSAIVARMKSPNVAARTVDRALEKLRWEGKVRRTGKRGVYELAPAA
jgi:hypothetical protein